MDKRNMSAVRMYKPQIETAPRDVIQGLQFRLFKNQISYVYQHSLMYRKKYDEVGIKPEDIKTPEDIKKVPFTTKEDLRKAQEANPPFGDVLCVPVEEGVRVFQTSGTTGIPLRVMFTVRDWFGFACQHIAHQAYGYGIKRSDTVFFPFGYGLFVAWWAWQAGLESMGVTVVPGGGQSSKDRIRNLIDWGATVLVGTPTYIVHLGNVAKAMGIDLATQSQIRIVALGGEPGAEIPATRKLVEEVWGAKCYDAIGATEMPVSFGFECTHQQGIHIIESMFLAEVVNPETSEPVDQGEEGELIMTNLCMETMPLIRYKMRDIARLVDDQCDCGRTFVRMEGGVLGRVDDMIIFGGVNIYPSAIENFVRSVEAFANEFQVIVPKRSSGKRLTIKVEPSSEDIGPDALKEATTELINTIKWKSGITLEIEITEIGSLPRFEFKAKRVIREG
jgi:phenylacetate-CoA ligase